MSTHPDEDERFWDEALERAGVPHGTDPAEVERMLDAAGDVPLDAAWIDQVVRSAAAQPAEQVEAADTPAPLPVVRRTHPLRRVAVAAAMLLAAAVGARLLVWPEGTHSRDTMNYAQAVLLLGMTDQPVESRSIGLATVFSHVQHGARTLASVRETAAADEEVAALAARRLQALQEMLTVDVGTFTPTPATDDMDSWCRTALDTEQSTAARSKAVEEVARLGALGILSVRTMPAPTADLQQERAIVLTKLQRELSR